MSETRQFIIFLMVMLSMLLSAWNLTETITLKFDLAARQYQGGEE